ncbi:hypothetical protein ACSQ67_006093 [Phaseolus vulgaris]
MGNCFGKPDDSNKTEYKIPTINKLPQGTPTYDHDRIYTIVWSEVEFLGKLSHPNLVKLIGYCWEDNQFLLDFNAKLSDFGLATLGPVNGRSHVTTRVMGT